MTGTSYDQSEYRERVVAGIRSLAQLIEGHPELPVPSHVSAQHSIIEDLDEAGRQMVVDAATQLGVEPELTDDRAVVNFLVARESALDEPVFRITYTVFGSVGEEPATESYGRDVDNGDPAAVVPEGVAGQAMGRASVQAQTVDTAAWLPLPWVCLICGDQVPFAVTQKEHVGTHQVRERATGRGE